VAPLKYPKIASEFIAALEGDNSVEIAGPVLYQAASPVVHAAGGRIRWNTGRSHYVGNNDM
jgi:hypothetical protein